MCLGACLLCVSLVSLVRALPLLATLAEPQGCELQRAERIIIDVPWSHVNLQLMILMIT